jgi:hypothetical protein
MEHGQMTIIERYETQQAADGQASFLVERGVGAAVEPDGNGSFGLAVLDEDASRAREIIGLVEPEANEPSEVDLIGAARPWLIPVLLIGVAMFVIPVVAFLVTFKLSGG